MVRTILILCVIVAAILWLPVWVQIALFAIAILAFPYRLVLFVPALIADARYTPDTTFTHVHFTMTLIVGAMLALWVVVRRRTRIGYSYVSKKK